MAKKLPKILNREEFEKLLYTAKTERDKFWKNRAEYYTPQGIRLNEYIAAMVLGFGGGLRISEILGLRAYVCKCHNQEALKSSEVTPEKKKRRIFLCSVNNSKLSFSQLRRGSGSWEVPPLTPERIENNMINIVSGKGGKDRKTLFPSKLLISAGITRADLEKMLPLKCSRRALQRYVTELGMRVLGKKISFHTSRHGFGSTMAGAGRPLHEIQMLMGHSRLDTTGIYLHANPQQAIKGAEEVFS